MFYPTNPFSKEYPCWLLKTVLLQGYMYVTTNHLCFYAYLPKKAVSWLPPRVPRGQLATLENVNPSTNG